MPPATRRASSMYFYPRPLRGGLLRYTGLTEEQKQFLSTPSARRATRAKACNRACRESDFYPRPLRGGRQDQPCRHPHPQGISIHALCEEGDLKAWENSLRKGVFLSTPSARRATKVHGPDRGAEAISIHALCEEGDDTAKRFAEKHNLFLSTPSARRATPAFLPLFRPLGISIHALCEEGDPPVSDWSLD